MKLSILVPFRDADGTRTRAKEWMMARWAHYYPNAEIIEASDDGVDPFNKSMAVNKAARLATGDTFIILDADSWVSTAQMDLAFHHLKRGLYKWVIPARKSFRLTQETTERILALPPEAEFPLLPNSRKVVEQSGSVVGFIHVVPRAGFEAVGGMDERFRGWGGEDSCFVRALNVVFGRHIQLPGAVWSLWHARPRGHGGRIWQGQTPQHYAIRAELGKRYGTARTRAQMLELLKR